MDIRFKKVTIHHFLSYDHAEVVLSDKGFCLVKGINRNPKDSAKSNGSGKSSLFNAISYALTGETLQGLKSNLANIYYGDGCYVELEFSVDGHEYKLLRSKDDSNLGTDLKITIDGQDKSGKGIRESSELLEQYLPDLTSQLIGSVVLIGQNMPMKFTSNTPSGRKEVLEHLTQSDYMIQDLKNRVAKRVEDLNGQIRVKEDALLSNTSKQDLLTAQLARHRQEYAEKYAEQVDYDAKIAKLAEEVISLSSDLEKARADRDKAKADESSLKPEVEALSEERRKALDEAAASHNKDVADFAARRSELRAKYLTVEGEIKQMESIRDVCPTCGRPFEGVVKPDTTAKKVELCKISEQLNSLSEEECQAEVAHKANITSINEKYSSKIQEKSAILEQIYGKERFFSDKYFSVNSQLLSKQADIQKTANERDLFEANKRKLLETMNETGLQIDALAADATKLKADKNILDEHLAAVTKMSNIIRRDFRGFLLKNIIDYIDAKAKDYAAKIFGCDEVSFTLDGNNIGITFCGKDYENLSGGEKQRLDLIIQFAIRDFISQYLSFSCNVLVLDEITDALDSESCEKVVSFIIEELGSIESVFIISHHADELELPRDSELLVEKSADGISRVVA